MHLTRLLAFLLVAVTLALAIAGTLGDSWGQGATPVYSVSILRAQLERNSQAWAGRVVWVRANAEACMLPMDGPGSPCRERHPVLVDAATRAEADALPLSGERTSRLLATLRRLPVVGRLLPPTPVVLWGTARTYRVQLRRMPCPSPGSADCFSALVLSAAR